MWQVLAEIPKNRGILGLFLFLNPKEKKSPSSSIQDDNSYEIIGFLPIILLFLWQYDEGVVGKRISFGMWIIGLFGL